MTLSRSTTNVDVVAMMGTIVFKRAECTSGNVKRQVRIVCALYCCRVEGESLISASIDHFE